MSDNDPIQTWMEELGWEKHPNFYALKGDPEMRTTMSIKSAAFFYAVMEREKKEIIDDIRNILANEREQWLGDEAALNALGYVDEVVATFNKGEE